ncbi:DUF2142 domain-containing protein [Candidatus Saccharibacteria bacterium]|nr:DUF2142 domain-containing protein [Candidatus Saccharibacteria bacterium]
MRNKITKSIRKIISSPIRSFVIISIVFGTLLVALTPPFAGGDEEAHFIRAYGISRGQLTVERYGEVEIPQSYRKTLGCMQTSTPIPGEMYKYDSTSYGNDKTNAFKCAFSLPLDRANSEAVFTTASSYSPTTYIPQVLAIWVGKIFNLPIIAMLYLMRIFVMIAYVAMIAFAVWLLPVRKWALVGIALLPYSILHFNNPGGDYMLYGSISIFVAAIVRSMYLNPSQLLRQDRWLLPTVFAAGVMMVLPKGMIPGILFLPLLVFYGGLKKYKWQKILSIAVIATIALLWQWTVGNDVMEEPSSATSSLFTFPLAFIKTMFYGWTGFDFLYNGSGGGGAAAVPSVVISIVNMMIMMYLLVDYRPDNTKIKSSILTRKIFGWVSIVIALLVVVASFAAIHIAGSYLQDGSNIIKGVQIRYYYPALFMLAIVPFARVFVTKETTFRNVVIGGSCVALATTVFVTLLNYQWGVFGGLLG